MDLGVSFQYQIIAAKVPDLYAKLGLKYDTVIQATAMDAIKSTAPYFSSTDFLENRAEVETTLIQNVTAALTPLYTELVDLQLQYVNFPQTFTTKMLNIAIQTQVNEKEQYIQTATVYRSNTTYMGR